MAVIHQATISPTKRELVAAWLDAAGLGSGAVELIGGYRFDDPDGEVGVEGLLAQRGAATYHLPLSYRSGPLAGAEESLICTMEHSSLGRRWIHHAAADPVATACFTRALTGEQQQAVLEYHREDGGVELREPAVRVRREGGAATGALAFTLDTAQPVTGDATLVASWDGGEAVVAALR